MALGNLNIPQGSGSSVGGAVAVKDEGTTVVATASAMNFVGAGVTAADGGGGVATVTIPGGGSPTDVFDITTYGATTGSSDNTAAVQAAIAAANANGGGIVYVPAGTFICTGRLSIPGGVSAGQVAITIRGCAPQGIAMANIEASEPSTGSVLDLRYTDAGASGKIVALYEGIFGLKDIRIGCSLSTNDDTPLVYVTLPQPRFEAVTFFGNTTHRTTACVQDAIVLGGTGTSHVENSVSSPFSGYGGFVRECSFWAIRKHVLMQNWVDGVVVEGNITDRSSCGSSETNSAPYVVDSGGTSASFFAMGNIFQNNTIEVERYNYAFRFKNNAKNNVVRGNGIWDPLGGTTLGLAYVEESSGATNNWLRFDSYSHSSFQNLGGITAGAGLNMVEKQGTQSPTTLFEYKPAGWQMFLNGTTNGNQSLIYDATIDGPLLAGNGGVGIRSAGRNQKAGLYVGSGSPETVVTATPGSVYFNVAGGASTSFYVKESGTGNTGWIAYGAPSGASISDTAYDATTWDAVTTVAPSKNAVRDKIETLAPLASPTLTGTPAAPTAAQGTNTTQLATTAYVQTEVGLLVPKSLVDAKGDLFIGTADNTVARKAVGANGKSFIADSTQTDGIAWDYPPHARSFAIKPTGALFETFDRNLCALSSGAGFFTSGTLAMTAIALPAGVTITSISMVSGATALSGGTHAWAALFDSSLALLRQSTDDTSPVWGATSVKTFTLSSTFVTTYSGLHYIGVMIAATTVPNVFIGPASTTSNVLGLAPILSGNSTGSLTGTAPNPAAALTVKAAVGYAYVS